LKSIFARRRTIVVIMDADAKDEIVKSMYFFSLSRNHIIAKTTANINKNILVRLIF
jgi:hypothetical protein